MGFVCLPTTKHIAVNFTEGRKKTEAIIRNVAPDKIGVYNSFRVLQRAEMDW